VTREELYAAYVAAEERIDRYRLLFVRALNDGSTPPPEYIEAVNEAEHLYRLLWSPYPHAGRPAKAKQEAGP
jgi:hypothetical protein